MLTLPSLAEPDERASGLGQRAGARRGLTLAAGGAAMAAAGLAIVLAERRWPLRRQTQPAARRVTRNLALAAMSMAVAALVQTPLTRPLAQRAERRRMGLVQRLPLPAWARDAGAFLLMDYTIYLWHVATHRNAFLWRFHLVHHLDLDLDSSTALRFHAADMALSVPYRLLQVALIGTSPRALRHWQGWFFLSVLFHHSNVRLPVAAERRLARLLTTPRMHSIHHSAARDQTHSNWSSGLSVWDRLHGTFRFHEPHPATPIGVPAYRSPQDVRLARSLALPFVRQRDAWALATSGPQH
jgi:sterol desaturase/sphingolipid hydroxylase (fatty acid hydroxylase superfamily)